jgi:hypothetical protein
VSTVESNLVKNLGERFDPFHDPYLADPYPFFAEARTATPVFYSPAIDYWVVTRYHDIRQIFQTPRLFSASNALAPIQPICPEAERILAEGGFRPVPTLTNNDPPTHTRVRRLANVAFTMKRAAAMEPFIRELTVRFVRDRLSSGRADLVRDLAWELPGFWCKLSREARLSLFSTSPYAASTASHTWGIMAPGLVIPDVSNCPFLILFANSIPLNVTSAFQNVLNPSIG